MDILRRARSSKQFFFTQSLERKKVTDDQFLSFSKQVSLNEQPHYDMLEELIKEDQKCSKISKHYQNCLAMIKTSQSSYLVAYPNEKKTHLNIESLRLDRDEVLCSIENIGSDVKATFNPIS